MRRTPAWALLRIAVSGWTSSCASELDNADSEAARRQMREARHAAGADSRSARLRSPISVIETTVNCFPVDLNRSKADRRR